eukprot:TRINITY_DN13887_c0_g1_i1.p1 TRINITY_DN13887_c0_g1~~TRINITY_DN13887_c0_g1_i1.p1  ORF type:complete len:347 (+),score=29.61 TRINITY_DN13887_c0_g1_i1:479-1519(+)
MTTLSRPDHHATRMSLPHAEVNWENLDKTKFFVVGTGLFSGVTAALYPFSVIKTRLQVSGAAAGSIESTAFGTVRSIARAEGLPGFYRGFGTVVAGTIPGRVVFLSTLEVVKGTVMKATADMDLSETTSAALASGAGGLCASMATQTVVVPIDVISSRLMAQGRPDWSGHTRYKGGWDALRTILRTEGVIGLYRGFGMSMITYAPSSATWWSTYGASQRILWSALGYGDEGRRIEAPSSGMVVLVQAVGGTCAGGAAAIVTTPLDTVKTRIQVLQTEGGATSPSVSATVRDLLKEHGLKGFYRGLGPRWASMALWGTCMITCYEFLKRLSVKPNLEEPSPHEPHLS